MSPDFITPRSFFHDICVTLSLTHLVALHAPRPCTGEGVSASTLLLAPLWLGAMHRAALKGCLIMSVELNCMQLVHNACLQ